LIGFAFSTLGNPLIAQNTSYSIEMRFLMHTLTLVLLHLARIALAGQPIVFGILQRLAIFRDCAKSKPMPDDKRDERKFSCVFKILPSRQDMTYY
jgi:hypothetical protein